MIGRRVVSFGASAVLHVAMMAATVWLASRATFIVRAVQAREPQIILVAPSKQVPHPDDLGIEAQDDSVIALPGFTFDFSKIAKRSGSLFPFLTGSVALETIASSVAAAEPRRLRNPFGGASAEAPGLRRPLELNDGEVQALVDKAWSRRDRWRPFQTLVPLIQQHDPNSGGVPALLRAYVRQNGLQPYVEGPQRDPRFWSQLGLAADHADFVDFIGEFVHAHPATKASTELMFLLDQIAQASSDTLVMLLETDPESQLQWTRQFNPTAYRTIGRIREYYLDQLHRRGLVVGDVRRYYETARLSFLDVILQTTPANYRDGDARFLIGAIHWRANRVAAAAGSWRAITPEPSDLYFQAYSDVLKTVSSHGNIESGTVERALEAERSRWINFSYERLHHFGYRFNTF